MFQRQQKKLQQKQQQHQQLGNNNSNQNYVDQLSSSKQASRGQYPHTNNETSAQDLSRTFMINNNTQMLQHGGPSELVFSQNYNLAPQFDMSAYLSHAPNSAENLNQYSHLKGSFLSSQENNLFGQVPVGRGFNSEILPNYPQQGIPMQKSAEFEKSNEYADSLDPLEKEILYNTDGSSWESTFSKMRPQEFGNSTVETPSMLSGSWSALMQFVMAETSSNNAGIQEEWSGLNFQNSEPLFNAKKQQNDWVDRNLQNYSSLISKPENLFQNISSFNYFQQSAQYIKQKEENHPEFSHATMQYSPRNTSQLVDKKSHPDNNSSGREFGGTFGIRGSTSGQMPSIQNKHYQGNSSATSFQFSTCSARTPPQDYSELKIPVLSGSELPLLENVIEIRPSLTPDMRQHAGLSMGPPTPWPENQNSFQQECQKSIKNKTLFHQTLSTRDAETDNISNQHSIAYARKLLLSGQQQPSGLKAFSMPYNQNTDETNRNKLAMQMNLTSVVCQSSTAVTPVTSKQLNPACVLSSDITHQTLSISTPKKRKLAALDMVPWHEEVNLQQSRLQDISTAEYLWAEALNRKPEEALNEAEIIEALPPLTRAKRRLICSTQLMQQVFQPAPPFILCADAFPNCACVAYLAARLTLGDAWSLTGQLASDTNNMSLDELKTSKRTKACDFAKNVEALINRVNKIEADLPRLDNSISYVDMKVDALELEKFSTINHLSKFHIGAHPINSDPASSSGKAASLKNSVQKQVVPVPMPETVPEGKECISL